MNISDRIINPLTTTRAAFVQGKGAKLPYTIDYGVMLNGDAIVESVWLTKAPVTVESAFTATNTTAVISGIPGTHVITNRITTSGGVVEERQVVVTIKRDEQTSGDYQ